MGFFSKSRKVEIPANVAELSHGEIWNLVEEHLLAKTPQEEQVKQILKSRRDIDVNDPVNGDYYLSLAARHNAHNVCEYLLIERGARLNVPNKRRGGALTAAAANYSVGRCLSGKVVALLGFHYEKNEPCAAEEFCRPDPSFRTWLANTIDMHKARGARYDEPKILADFDAEWERLVRLYPQVQPTESPAQQGGMLLPPAVNTSQVQLASSHEGDERDPLLGHEGLHHRGVRA